jgi:hypothetical protein
MRHALGAILVLVIGSAQAAPTTLDFQELSAQFPTTGSATIISQGFSLTTEHGFFVEDVPDKSLTYCIICTLTLEDENTGSPFSLESMDFAVFSGSGGPVTVTGYYAGGGMVSTDLSVSGTNGSAFQTYSFGVEWGNLDQVLISAATLNTGFGNRIDNIVLQTGGVPAPDADNDGEPDATDNCPAIPNPLQSNVDGDTFGDTCDVCPNDATDTCNVGGSIAQEVSTTDDVTIVTPDGALEIDIDPGDLSTNTTISVTESTDKNDPDVALKIGTNQGNALAFYELDPDGLDFAPNTVTLTVSVDVTNESEPQALNLDLYRFNETTGKFDELTASCVVNETPPFSMVFIGTCMVEIDHLSTYAIVTPRDSDGDGVFDDFNGEVDACPAEDATGFDADSNGCIDSFAGLLDLLAKLGAEEVIDDEMQNSLISKVSNADKSYDKDKICTAINQLGAFKNQVAAQTGNKISVEAAEMVTAYADNLIALFESEMPSGESC